MKLKSFIFIPLLWLVTMAPMCSDSNLANVAGGLNKASIAVDTVQSTVMEAFELGVFKDDVDENGVVTQTAKQKADTIVVLTVKVARAIGLANGLTREFTTMPEGGRDQLLEILLPVIETLEEGLTDESLDIIPDGDLKSAVEFGFRAALLGLQTAQTLLEARN